jgi:hypothetical protein
MPLQQASTDPLHPRLPADTLPAATQLVLSLKKSL